ncbi:tetratricopeptide repeat protein [Gaopeijia maritima]|uniref:Tetratricopeptide repeat protein n=1 Tax=Gaopeijia maritima TaxID=3119007 RepID=A0ABU9E8R4_9BACT
MRGWVRGLAAVLVWAGALLGASAAVAAQEEAYLQGNQLYQDGEFEGAVESYRAVLAAGVESATLHYNLGNALFKAGELGPAILSWERALALDPGLADARSNLALARTLTVDDIEPLPTFWLVSAWRWWVGALPRAVLLGAVALGWFLVWGGVAGRILARREGARRAGTVAVVTGVVMVVVLGVNVAVREFGVGQVRRGVIMVEAVAVRSAPTEDDNLTLFEIHEGTVVRIDQRTDSWAEVVLDDGKVGWVPTEALEEV